MIIAVREKERLYVNQNLQALDEKPDRAQCDKQSLNSIRSDMLQTLKKYSIIGLYCEQTSINLFEKE